MTVIDKPMVMRGTGMTIAYPSESLHEIDDLLQSIQAPSTEKAIFAIRNLLRMGEVVKVDDSSYSRIMPLS